MRLSDLIADFILSGLSDGGEVELQRSELADRFNCVPSQINYVISTRFAPEHGYLVESRRGGGGYIRISRLETDRPSVLMHTVNAIGDSLSFRSAVVFMQNLLSYGAISEENGKLILSAVSETALASADVTIRPRLRASIMKQCLLSLPKYMHNSTNTK